MKNLGLYYSYQCEKNIELYMLYKSKIYYPLVFANEWDFIYNKNSLNFVEIINPIGYPERNQTIIMIEDKKYQENMKSIFNISITKKHLIDISSDVIQVLKQNLYLGINLDYYYLMNETDEHYIHSLLIANYKKNKLFLVDPKKEKLLTEWVDFEKVYLSYFSKDNNRQYYTILNFSDEQKHEKEIDDYITKAMLKTYHHILNYLGNEKNGIIPLKNFLMDFKNFQDFNLDKIYYILELIFSLLTFILNQKNNYYLYINLLLKKTGDKNFKFILFKLTLLQQEWEILKNLFYKTKNFHGKVLMHGITSLYEKIQKIIDSEQNFMNYFLLILKNQKSIKENI